MRDASDDNNDYNNDDDNNDATVSLRKTSVEQPVDSCGKIVEAEMKGIIG